MPEDKPKRYFEWMEPEPKPEPEKPQPVRAPEPELVKSLGVQNIIDQAEGILRKRAAQAAQSRNLVSLPLDLAGNAIGVLYVTLTRPCAISSLELIFADLISGLIIDPIIFASICVGSTCIFEGVYLRRITFDAPLPSPVVYPGQCIRAKIENQAISGLRAIMQIQARELET